MKKTTMVALTILITLVVGASTTAAPPEQSTSTNPASTVKELALDLGDKASLKLVQIPAGKFVMGSPIAETFDQTTGEVQHEVTISQPFNMGATLVTVEQFALFAKATDYKTDAEKDGYSYSELIKNGSFDFAKVNGLYWKNPGIEQKGDHPVIHVSWNDAQAFCGWLSKKSGMTVTLPTEAQWEYACRAGTTTAFPWGDDPNAGKGWANCADQTLKQKLPKWDSDEYFKWDDGFVYTSPVETFKPNAFGLYDMIGNVQQWCQDYYGNYAKGPATDPTGATTGKDRVLRGGSWHTFAMECRAAYRDGQPANFRHDGAGFRVAVLPVIK